MAGSMGHWAIQNAQEYGGVLVSSVDVAAGPPLDGLLIQRNQGNYEYAQIFAALCLLVGCGFMSAARMVKAKGRIWGVKV